jgi:hypothetical protein
MKASSHRRTHFSARSDRRAAGACVLGRSKESGEVRLMAKGKEAKKEKKKPKKDAVPKPKAK